ncbi:hypothetical protein GCM10010287_61310 [Streptomyces variabilis]|uniref:Uncharacterized protein n=1 Tax=Streptomyces variabilis TaxID=67372 RepID=A0ABQ2U7M4_9ACTN|nr:hypothetical protein GCM10010265_35300 [Streptomyces griseoincarnatus]GGT78773.1 hypothetical protein GCM10010287_61310 [Streptomyces variabilis]
MDHDPYSREGGKGDEDGDRFDEDCEDESDDEESHHDASQAAGFAPTEATWGKVDPGGQPTSRGCTSQSAH